MAWESVFHGNPSGVDVAAAMHGGLLRFSRTERLSVVVAPHPIELCVGLTGRVSATHEMVARVGAFRQQDRARFEQILAGLSDMVAEAQTAIERADAALLGELMDRAQRELGAVGVSTSQIEQLCHAARTAGARGAKLTGAGGGGVVIALLGFADRDEDVESPTRELGARVLGAWKACGYEGFTARVGVSRNRAQASTGSRAEGA
jgi:mevalonate kinase